MVTKGNVLVVDDEINLCRILGAKLAKSGYSVVAVHDGLQAVEKVRESDFDVVLLDLILPKMDGLTALAEIRGMRSALPVIIMTACENAESLAQAQSYGVSAYVNKPFDLDNLVSLVSSTSVLRDTASAKRLPNATVLFCKDQPVTLEVPNSGHARTYCGWVHDKDDRTLSVRVPLRDNNTGDIAPRAIVRVGLAAMDAYYSFTTHAIRTLENPLHTVVLDKPGVIYRAQRRENPRRVVRMPITYRHYCEDSLKDSESRCGETIDISLGGVCLSVSEEICPADILHIEMQSKDSRESVGAIAHVVRSSQSKDPARPGYILGCRFVSVDESLRNMIGG